MLNRKVIAGFDGYIDRIYKAIREESNYFTNIYDFGNYLMSKHPRSCAIQMDLVSERMGGNAPLFVNTLRRLVSEVNLVGMLGKDIINPLFNNLPLNGLNISFADPAETIAIEYSSSKLFLSPRLSTLPDLDDIIKKYKLEDMMIESDLVALLNWGEIDFMMDLWKLIWNKVFSSQQSDSKKFIFIDLADISRHSTERIENLLLLIKDFATKRKVILGLNGNECQMLSKKLNYEGSIIDQMRYLYSKSDAAIVVHTKDVSMAFDGESFAEKKVRVITNPVIATGVGDNFNAGFCYGILNEYSLEKCIEYGNSCAYIYLKSGSPCRTVEDLESTVSRLYY